MTFLRILVYVVSRQFRSLARVTSRSSRRILYVVPAIIFSGCKAGYGGFPPGDLPPGFIVLITLFSGLLLGITLFTKAATSRKIGLLVILASLSR